MLEPRAGDIWSYWWLAKDKRFYLLIEKEEVYSADEMKNWNVMDLHDGKIRVMSFRMGLEGYWRREG